MNVEYLVIHTAAYDGEHDDLEDIIRWHKERGFRTIGYHYYIRKDGTIRKGREDDRMGAHCKANDMNFKSLGICFEGHHDKEEWTEDQKGAFYKLATVLRNRHHIPIENVIGHREAYETVPPPKTCPGKMISMNDVREKLDGVYEEKITGADLEPLDGGQIEITEEMTRI